jgi:hypothetical protein
MKFATTLRTARAQAIIDAAGTNPKLKFYTSTESLTPAGTLLATLNVNGALGTAASGVIDYNETVTQTNSSHVAGTPTFCLITTSADVAVTTLAIPSEMPFSGTIATGVNVTWNASTLTEAGV